MRLRVDSSQLGDKCLDTIATPKDSRNIIEELMIFPF